MDKDIKVLEKIGLQEVCKKTHIEVKQLEYMVNNQYDKLSKINTLGFVKILSREYKLDLSDWLEGFYDYWADSKTDEDKIFVRANSDRSYKKVAWIFLVILFVSGIFAVISIFKIDTYFFNLIDKANFETTTNGYQSTPIVQEAAKSLGVKVEERMIETNSSNSTIEAVIVSIDENITKKVEANESIASPILQQNNKNIAQILPKRKIWIGIISLSDFSRKISSGEEVLTIDLTKKQLIKTGNGYFTLSYDGTVEDFVEQGSTRFLVDNGTIKKISEETFVQLNKGKNW
ncbi:MAG: hypothetical protein J0647_01275 [Campylobacteraceae bacterium]|nr:hypothetical protein [Campylobacteraceae bacterium]